MSIGNESVAGEYEVSIQVSRIKIFKNAYQKNQPFFPKPFIFSAIHQKTITGGT